MTPRPILLRTTAAALAATSVFAFAACGSDDDGEDAAAQNGESADAPSTDLGAVVLGEDEAPGQGLVRPVAPEDFAEQVAALEESQQRETWDDPACDQVTRIESVTNHVASDGVTRVVHYRDPDDEEIVHSYPFALAEAELPEFMDRAFYETCVTARNIEHPQYEIHMHVTDAPHVEGAAGFRVTTDLVTNHEDGTQDLRRTLAIHGEADGVTALIEYQASGPNTGDDPVRPEAHSTLDDIYVAQMEKILAG